MRRTPRRMTQALLIAAALAARAQGRLAAQTAEGEEGGSRICFRGRPLPACRSFWIVEMQGYTPLTQTTRFVDYGGYGPVPIEAFEDQLEWNFGHMANLTPGFALGGVFTLGTGGGSGAFAGLKARARRWLGQNVSVELEAGLLRTGVTYPETNGVTADARLNISDHGSFFVRWDAVDVSSRDGGYYYSDTGGLQQALSVGAGLGSKPALFATGAAALGYLIVVSILLAGDD